jgi:hypothetical protein
MPTAVPDDQRISKHPEQVYEVNAASKADSLAQPICSESEIVQPIVAHSKCYRSKAGPLEVRESLMEQNRPPPAKSVLRDENQRWNRGKQEHQEEQDHDDSSDARGKSGAPVELEPRNCRIGNQGDEDGKDSRYSDDPQPRCET